jgi:hypothetical protein
MASKRWVGRAQARAQVNTLTVGGTVEIGDLFRVTIGVRFVEVAATTTSTATTAGEIQAALAASTIPEFQEISWTVLGSVVTATARTAGKPFTLVALTTESNGGAADAQTFVNAAGITNKSPNDLNDADNWDTGSLPADGDDAFFDNSNVPVYWNLGALSAVTLASLNIAASFTADIGLPEITATGYFEYRATELAIGATAVRIGNSNGNGSSRIKLNTGSVQTVVDVGKTGSSAESNLEAFLFRGTHASNVVNVSNGSVGIGVFNGQAATVATLRVAGGRVRTGQNVTLTTVQQSGGTLEIASNATTVNKSGGTLTILAGAFTTITNDDGQLVYRSTGTITTLNVGPRGVMDFSQDIRARTVTNAVVLVPGATYNDPHGTTVPVSFAAGRWTLRDVTINVGVNRAYAVT